MPNYIIKADPMLDLYGEWSTVVDDWLRVGPSHHFEDIDPSRMKRASLHGTSSFGREGGWGSHGFVYRQDGYLPRLKFGASMMLALNDDLEGIRALLEPFEDDVVPDYRAAIRELLVMVAELDREWDDNPLAYVASLPAKAAVEDAINA